MVTNMDNIIEEQNLTNRQKQALKTKKKIFDTAIKLLKEVGFENLTINKICKEAGVAVGSFYYYYKSLDFVVVELYKKVDGDFKRIGENDVLTGSTKDRILKLVDIQVNYGLDLGLDFIIQLYKSQVTMGSEYFGSWERELPKIFIDTIAEGQTKGEVKGDYEASKIGREIIILVRGYIYDWCVHKGNYDLLTNVKEAVEKYLEFYLT